MALGLGQQALEDIVDDRRPGGQVDLLGDEVADELGQVVFALAQLSFKAPILLGNFILLFQKTIATHCSAAFCILSCFELTHSVM